MSDHHLEFDWSMPARARNIPCVTCLDCFLKAIREKVDQLRGMFP